MMKRLILITLVSLWLTSCGGDNNKTDTPPQPVAPTVTPTTDGEEPADRQVERLDIAGLPMTRGIITKDNITVLASSYFTQGNLLYVSLLARNDNDAPVRQITVSFSTIDADNLRLSDFSISSAFNSIPSGQVIALQGIFPIGEYYDGISALVVADLNDPGTYTPYHEAETSAELDPENKMVRGTALNNSRTPQPLQVAYFILYGENQEDLLGVIPAIPVSGLDQGIWQPGVSISYEAPVTAIAGGDLSAVKAVGLIVAGYSLTSGS
ncbi:MAG: hypothetical protein H6673_07540 [Anaerolineales bacterium]|nr:hypothetical protein [Anaerolineales bacterium]